MTRQRALITGRARSGKSAFAQKVAGDVCGATNELCELAVLLLGPLEIH